jgi:hypothetical protein
MRDCIAESCAFPHILWIAQQHDPMVILGEPLKYFPGAVGALIVNNNKFETADQFVLQREDSANARLDDMALVKYWYQDAEPE